jgi:zinc protease
MKYLLTFIAIGSMLMSSSFGAEWVKKGEGKFFPYDFLTETLDNGLKVYCIPMEAGGLASYYTIVRTGSRDEWEEGKSGFAHFFEHMMFRGTKKFPQSVYDSIVISLGADANAYTTDDYTCYHMNIASEDLSTVMDLESERFQNLFYEEPAFKTESGAVYGEFRKGRTQPFNVMWEKLKETAFDEHTYQHTTIGYEADIKNMPNMYKYSKSFYDRYYRPENCIVLVAGSIDAEKTMTQVKEYYKDWKPGYTMPEIDPEPEQKGERTGNADYPGKTNPMITIAFKKLAYDPASKEVIANQLLGELAFGSNSDLYKKLYLKEQKVLWLAPEFSMNRDPFLSMITAQTPSEDDLDYVRDEIYSTIEHFKTNLTDEKTLANLKKRMKYGSLMSMGTPDNLLGGMARFVALTGGIEEIETEFTTMETITPEDIQNAARRMTEDQRTVITLKGAK